jgi:putative addiction module antidote
MEQTVIKVGNSIGVIIPKNLRNGLKAGDKVVIGGEKDKITVSPVAKKQTTGGVNAKFMKMVDEFMTEHKDVLQELANK